MEYSKKHANTYQLEIYSNKSPSPNKTPVVFRKNKRGPKKGYIKDLEEKVCALEKKLQDNLLKIPKNLRTMCFSFSAKKQENQLDCLDNSLDIKKKKAEKEEPKLAKQNFLFAGNLKSYVYVGETCLSYLFYRSAFNNSVLFLIPEFGISKKSTLASIEIESNLSSKVLNYLFAKYLRNFYHYFPIIDKELLKSKLQNLHDVRQLYCSKMHKYLIYAIISVCFSKCELNHMVDGVNIGKLCCDCYENLVDHFESMFDPTISNIQTLLHFIIASNPRNRYVFWKHTGAAIEMAYYLKLNVDECIKRSSDYKLLKNIWWGCYIVDKFSSLIFGRPSRIKENSYDIKELSLHKPNYNRCDIDETQTADKSTVIHDLDHLYFIKISQLARIIMHICDKLYFISQEGSLALSGISNSCQKLNAELENWYSDFQTLSKNNRRKKILYDKQADMFVFFHVCKILVYRKNHLNEEKLPYKIEYLKKMLNHAEKIKVLVSENIKMYPDSASFYKCYPLYSCVFVYIMNISFLRESKENRVKYLKGIFEIMHLIHRFRAQSYLFRTVLNNIVEQLRIFDLYLSSLNIKMRDTETKDLMELIISCEKKSKNK